MNKKLALMSHTVGEDVIVGEDICNVAVVGIVIDSVTTLSVGVFPAKQPELNRGIRRKGSRRFMVASNS